MEFFLLIVLLCCANAAKMSYINLRGSSGKYMRNPCLLTSGGTTTSKNEGEANWNCMLNPQDRFGKQDKTVQILGLDQHINDAGIKIKSGVTMLAISPAIEINNLNEIYLNKKSINVTFTEDYDNIHSVMNTSRSLASKVVKTVLAVRILSSSTPTTPTEEEMIKGIFGSSKNPDEWNLVNGFSKCSSGKLKFKPPEFVPSGVVTVTVNVDEYVKEGIILRPDLVGIIDEAMEELKKELNNGEISQMVDEIMFCMPPTPIFGPPGKPFQATAFPDNNWSIYHNTICLSPSYHMHELGHNLDLGHSESKVDQRGDASGVMGYSYSGKDGPRMCFNGAKNHQLEWFQDKMVSLDSTLSLNSNLVGAIDYDNIPEKHSVLIDIDGTNNRYVVSFNRMSNFNDGTKLGGNQVLIHSRSRNEGRANSLLERIMNEGDEHLLFGIRAGTKKKNIMIRVDKIDLKSSPAVASISIVQFRPGDLTKGPTQSPQGVNECGTNTPIPKSECPSGKKNLNILNCEKVAYGELCNGRGECKTESTLNNCIFDNSAYDVYMKTEDNGMGKCGIPLLLSEGECPKKKILKKLKSCKKVAYGEMCKATKKKKCGTNRNANNCGKKDVYIKSSYKR